VKLSILLALVSFHVPTSYVDGIFIFIIFGNHFLKLPSHLLVGLSIDKALFQPKCASRPTGRYIALCHAVIQIHLQNNYLSFLLQAGYLNKCFPNKACSWVEFEKYNN
jgi:hypothetical protein